jgi:hypothetical protein
MLERVRTAAIWIFWGTSAVCVAFVVFLPWHGSDWDIALCGLIISVIFLNWCSYRWKVQDGK